MWFVRAGVVENYAPFGVLSNSGLFALGEHRVYIGRAKMFILHELASKAKVCFTGNETGANAAVHSPTLGADAWLTPVGTHLGEADSGQQYGDDIGNSWVTGLGFRRPRLPNASAPRPFGYLALERNVVKTTEYFRHVRRRPDRARILDAWIERALRAPLVERDQVDGRVQRWVFISEEQRYLRVVLLADRETVHNAFFDRRFKP